MDNSQPVESHPLIITLVPPPPSHRLRKALITLLIISTVASACVWSYCAGLLSKPATVAIASPTPTPSITPMPTIDSVKSTIKLDILNSNGGVTSTKNIKFTAQTPTSWRIQGPTNTKCENGPYDGVKTCGTYKMVNAVGSPTSLIQTNSVVIYDLTTWLGTDDYVDPITHRTSVFTLLEASEPALTSSHKKELLNYMLALKPSDAVTWSNIEGKMIFPLFHNNGIGGIDQTEYIQSADGNLKGYTFIASLCQVACYVPSSYSIMAGYVDGTPMLIVSSVKLNDQKAVDLEKLKYDSDEWNKLLGDYGKTEGPINYIYGTDTIKMFKDVKAVIETMSLTAK